MATPSHDGRIFTVEPLLLGSGGRSVDFKVSSFLGSYKNPICALRWNEVRVKIKGKSHCVLVYRAGHCMWSTPFNMEKTNYEYLSRQFMAVENTILNN